MDVRMQKHRRIHWLVRVLAVLTLAGSCEVHAGVESVPGIIYYCGPEFTIANSLYNPLGTAGCTYTNELEAAQADIADYNARIIAANPTTLRYAVGSCQAILPITLSSRNVCNVYITFTDTPDQLIPDGGFTLPIAFGCPVPKVNPTVPYSVDAYYSANTNSLVAICTRPAQQNLIITLSGDTEVEPSKGSTLNTLPIIATVKDQNGQAPNPAVTVHVSLKVDSKSGGHDHGDSTRLRGGIAGVKTCATDSQCWWGTTDGNGQVVFNFNPTETSGTHTISATCDGNGRICTNTATWPVDVKVDGLEIIPDSSFYAFVGDTNNHSKNHYLTPDASTVLRNIAISYRIENKFWQLKQMRRGKKGQYTNTPPSMLNVNDASLIWGGKFDIHGKWVGDHSGHRRGIVADIRANQININNGAIPLQSFSDFQDLATSYDAIAQVHCSHDGQNRQPPACIGNDGTQDDGRHMHVILIGEIDK